MSDETVEYETIELEYSEDDIAYYIVDENDVEIGFALLEDGEEVEYYYEGYDGADYVSAPEPEAEAAAQDEVEAEDEPIDEAQAKKSSKHTPEADAEVEDEQGEPSTLRKLATIAGAEADKLRGKASKKADQARAVAEEKAKKARTVAESQAKKAAKKAKESAKKLKEDAEDDFDLGITREDVTEAAADLNVIAREGSETVAELKEAYDDIMGSFGFLKKKR